MNLILTRGSLNRKMNFHMQGYAVSKREHYPDIFGVAASILCSNGNLLAILVAAMPYPGVSRNRQDQIVRKVVQTGKKISVLFRLRAKDNEISHTRGSGKKKSCAAGASA